MVKPAWGTKRICQSCGARFYDLMRDPIICPKCSAVYDPEAVLKTRRGRPVAGVEKPALKPAVGAETEAEAVEVDTDIAEEELVLQEEGEEDEEDLIEDASELGEDEEDMAEVIENVDEEER